jgi:hypothetical protein
MIRPVTAIALARVAAGAAGFAAPGLANRLFTEDRGAEPQLAYLTRVFASRELALGALTLLAGRSSGRSPGRVVALVGAAVDASDGYAGWRALRAGAVSTPTGAVLVAPALAAATAGAVEAIGRRVGTRH